MSHNDGQPSMTSAIAGTHMVVAAKSCTAWSWKFWSLSDQGPKKGHMYRKAGVSWADLDGMAATIRQPEPECIYYVQLRGRGWLISKGGFCR